MIYLYPTLSEKEEKKFYIKEFEKFMSHRAGKDMDWTGPEKHVASNQREVNRRMPFLEKYIKPGQSVLELGCSSGFMLSALKERGLKVFGLDPSGVFRDFVRAQGITVFDSLEALKNSNSSFDLLLHYYVLEHMRNPIEFIKEHMRFVSPSGFMIFEVPCASDPLVELYKVPAFDKFYWSVVHHWYFTRDTLAKMLTKTGFTFELFPDQRYDLSNHVTWMLDGKPGGMGRFSEIFGSECDQLYKEQLKKHWLCDTLVAVVKK